LTPDILDFIVGTSQRGDLPAKVFSLFDTDMNGKVDAFEVLSVATMLAKGDLDTKFETLYPVFDFSGEGCLSFDDIAVLIGSVCAGLAKVGNIPQPDDELLVQSSRQSFDCYNIPYDKTITKEQFKRWVRHDVEVVDFVGSFQRASSLTDLMERVANMEELEGAAFQRLCAGGTEVSAEALARSPEFREALGSPDQAALHGLLQVIAPPGCQSVGIGRFAAGTMAWNAFAVLDVGGTVDASHLPVLEWLSLPEREGAPHALSEAELGKRLLVIGLHADDASGILRQSWLAASLRGT